MRETEALELTRARLEELGFAVGIARGESGSADARITLDRNGNQETLNATIKSKVTLSAVAPRILEHPEDALFITERMNAKTAATFRRFGLQFVDYTGNVYLSSPGWIIDVRGKAKIHNVVEANDVELRRAGVDNLYSPKRAQVIFALLAWPELLGAPLRELSKCAGVSLGLAQSTVVALQTDWDLWPADRGRRERLIDAWAAAYPGNLGPSLHLGTFHSEGPIKSRAGVLVSGESAVPELLRPSRLIAYVKKLDASLIRDNRWRTDASPNVFVRRQFWQEPTAIAALAQSEESAPPLLVYGDLLASTDPRVRLAAKEFGTRVS